jgi:hypothetical protein
MTIGTEMNEDPMVDAQEALEALAWQCGYKGSAQTLDGTLSTVAAWIQTLVDDWAQDAQRAQAAEIGDLRRQIAELRENASGTPEPQVDMAALARELEARVEASEKAYWEAAKAWEEQRQRGNILPMQQVPEAAYEDFADQLDQIEADPYGDALLAALEEAAQEEYDQDTEDAAAQPSPELTELLTGPDVFEDDPCAADPTPQEQYSEFFDLISQPPVINEATVEAAAHEYAGILETLGDEGEPYASMTRAQLIEALKAAMAANPGVVLTGTAQPWPRPCRTCGELKGPEEFKKDKAMADGYRTDCKPCIRKRDKERADRKAQEQAQKPSA